MRHPILSLLCVLCALCGKSVVRAADASDAITEAQINAITYEDAEDDSGVVTPIAVSLDGMDDDRRKVFDEWMAKIDKWEGWREEQTGQRVRNVICLLSVIDIMQDQFEAQTALVVLQRLLKDVPKDKLIKAAAWVALKPDEGITVSKAPDLGYEDGVAEDRVRERAVIYAKKLLGRALGKLGYK